MLLHNAHITACYSRDDSDIHLIHRRLELESDHLFQFPSSIVHSALAPVLRRFPLLQIFVIDLSFVS